MFCERMRIRRLDDWRDLEDAVEDVKSGAVYVRSRVVLETDDALYINVRDVKGFVLSDLVKEAMDRYSYVSSFVGDAVRVAGTGEQRALADGAVYTSADIDRVLEVCMSMGQWAWAVCIICDVFGLGRMNAANVVWSGAPHVSRCGLRWQGGVVWLGGAMKTVVETWFIAHGGYYSEHVAYVDDRVGYTASCHSITSPWSLADVQRIEQAVSSDWLVASDVAALKTDVQRDDMRDGSVLYRNVDGKMLAYGLTNAVLPECERTAWLLQDRAALLAKCGVPMHLRGEILHG